MVEYKSKEKYRPGVNLMIFSQKYILITFIIFCVLLYSSSANGQKLISHLKGKWFGTLLFRATSTGFTSLKNSISINILEQM
jgi:hypothetical protein